MKKVNLIALLLFLATSAFTQSSAKRYIMLEHFTNTRCSVCASQNPGFFNTIANFEDDVHHIAYHPPYPYNNCLLYLANPSQNSARTSFYNISGTPRVVRNGLNSTSANQVTATVLQGMQGQTSPIALAVTETTGNSRQATIQVYTLGEAPAGNLRLFVAVAERELAYTSPNGETLHHNVFRKMLTDISGDAFTPAATGSSTTLTFDYTLENGWNAAEIYVLAFVQNVDTKEVLNSGTRFDPVLTATDEAALGTNFKIFPNPASGLVQIQFQEAVSGNLSLLDLNGVVHFSRPLENTTFTAIDLEARPPGVYVLRVQSEQGTKVKQIIRY
ncbi:MAG: Omp28-related outer membrane protein [Saprospiraceae bacterium]|nr:Omp28-related outer membrane protein [Saprospiraceae bacterium]